MGGREGLLRAAVSCRRLGEIVVGEEMSLAAVICKKIAGIGGGEGLLRAARDLQKWGEGRGCQELP